MKTYAVRFAVIGGPVSGAFPIDMLRYDGAYPADQESVGEIHESLDPRGRHDRRQARLKDESTLPLFRVRLTALVIRKDWRPTEARWSSFGWQVEQGSVRVDPL